MRGVTRTPTSAPALQWQDSGVEIIYGDMDHPDSMQSALHGATVVFGVTDFWQHLKNPEVHKQAAERGCSANEVGFEREIAQGKVSVHKVLLHAMLTPFEGAHRRCSCHAAHPGAIGILDPLVCADRK